MAGNRRAPSTLPNEPELGDVEGCLRYLVSGLAVASDRTGRPGRPPVVPALCVWGGLLVCVLNGFSSQLELWRLLSQTGLWEYERYDVSDQAIYYRLGRDGTTALLGLFHDVNQLLGTRLDPYLPQLVADLAPFATDIVAIDETTLDPVARRLPGRDGDPPAQRRLPGKLAGVFDLRRQQWRRFELIAESTQNEKVAARGLLDGLARGTLVVADLGYFGFAWFDTLSNRGLWYVSKLRQRTSYRVVQTFSQHGDTFDGLVWLGAYRSDQAEHLVRLVQYRHGRELRQYITNVRDPRQFPLADIVAVYGRRWDIEIAIRLIKQHLGLHVWWSSKDVVIQQQLIAVLIIAQILQALRLEIAARAKVEIFEVSMALLVRYLPRFAARGEDPIAVFVARGRAAGFIRLSRRIHYDTRDPPLALAESIATSIPITRTPRYAGKA